MFDEINIQASGMVIFIYIINTVRVYFTQKTFNISITSNTCLTI